MHAADGRVCVWPLCYLACANERCGPHTLDKPPLLIVLKVMISVQFLIRAMKHNDVATILLRQITRQTDSGRKHNEMKNAANAAIERKVDAGQLWPLFQDCFKPYPHRPRPRWAGPQPWAQLQACPHQISPQVCSS